MKSAPLVIPLEKAAPLKPSMMEWHHFEEAPPQWRWSTPGVVAMVVITYFGVIVGTAWLLYGISWLIYQVVALLGGWQ